MMDERTPILVGAGQVTQRDVDLSAAREPIDLMADAARAAIDDAGAARLLVAVDMVAAVNVFSWDYVNVPRLLAERLRIHPRHELYTTVGGNSPQMLVDAVAERIARGETDVALVGGAEAFNTLARARRAKRHLDWAVSSAPPPPTLGDTRQGTSAQEVAHNLQMPVQIYPLFENALRARAGLGIAEHRARLGRLMSGLSAVAASNPHAWFRTPRTADEIATITPENRLIGFPYPKLMNAIIDVDQAVAVVMTSVGRARALGIPPSRWVYLRGCAEAHDHWFVSERVDYTSSPAIRATGRAALEMAAVAIADVRHLDVYSCFPSAVQIGRDMLGIAADDPRPLTVTGGLAYFGGPGNAYSLHAIATMVERLRADAGAVGLVTALGWYITKHAVGVYSTAPPETPWQRPVREAPQAAVDAQPGPPLVAEASGPARIETYTVMHGRDGAPMVGTVIGRTDDERRFVASLPMDAGVLASLETTEGVGRRGTVRTVDGVNHFDPA